MQETQESKLIVSGGKILIQRPIDEPVWKLRFGDDSSDREGTSDGTRPLRCSWTGGSIWATHQKLPFTDASLDLVEVEDALELVRNDRRLYLELNRVIAPGGVLRARVPNTGVFAGFDSFNLYKYLTDITRHGLRIPETEEIAFRRHLSQRELGEALGEGFEIQRSWTTGTSLSEMVNMLALSAFTWRQERVDSYLKVQPWIRRFAKLDARIPLPGIGFWLHIEAIRLAV